MSDKGDKRRHRSLSSAAASPASGCAKELAKKGVQVTLVDQHNYHQFQPMLYQVATAQLSSSDIARPLRGIFRKDKSVDVKMAEVTAVDPVAKTVTCADGSTFTGDYLVLAMGSRPNFFRHARARRSTPSRCTRSTTPSGCGRGCSACSRTSTRTPSSRQGRAELRDRRRRCDRGGDRGGSGRLDQRVMPSRYHDLAVDRGPRSTCSTRLRSCSARSPKKAHDYASKVLTERRRAAEAGPVGDRDRPRQGGAVRRQRDPDADRGVGRWHPGRRPRRPTPGCPQGRGGRLDGQADLTVDGFPGVYAVGDVADALGARRQAFPAARLGRPAGRPVGRQEHPGRHRRQAPNRVPLPRQGHHGHDRPQHGDRRDGRAPPRAARRRSPSPPGWVCTPGS